MGHESKTIMMRTISLLLTLITLFISDNVLAQDIDGRYQLTEAIKTVTSERGETISVESGMFYVPESRIRDIGRTIAIAYYRIPTKSETRLPPIFILAGGPGSSYLNTLHKDKLFKACTFYLLLAFV